MFDVECMPLRWQVSACFQWNGKWWFCQGLHQTFVCYVGQLVIAGVDVFAALGLC